MAISKVVYKASASATPVVWMDATTATAAASDIISPKTAMLKNGVVTAGTGSSGGGYSLDDFNNNNISGAVTLTGTSIRAAIFAGNSTITSISAPNATEFGKVLNVVSHNLIGCTGLVSFSAPNITYSTNVTYIFRGCTALTTVSLPKCTAMYGAGQFQGCTSLEVLVLPKFGDGVNNANGQVSADWINGDTSFTTLDIYRPYSIAANALRSASSFNTLIIRASDAVRSLGNISAFNDTPFASGGTGGTLYVPNALLAGYQTASNWSTILGYTNNQIKKIEGSYYETHYADGTLIS